MFYLLINFFINEATEKNILHEVISTGNNGKIYHKKKRNEKKYIYIYIYV